MKYWYYRYKWYDGYNWIDADDVYIGDYSQLVLYTKKHTESWWLIFTQEITKEEYDNLNGIVG